MWPFKQKTRTSLGVDIGIGGIKLVELKNQDGRAKLVTYGFTEGGWQGELKQAVEHLVGSLRSMDGQGIPDAALRQIGSMVRQLHLKTKCTARDVTASIPITAVFSAVVTVGGESAGNAADINAVARREAVKLLPLPETDMVIDLQRIALPAPAEDGQVKMLVTATSRVLIEEYTKIFKYAGLMLTSLETESFALIRALLGRDKSPAFVIDIGAERSNLFVVDGGVPLIHRSMHLGGASFNGILQTMFQFSSPDLVEQAKIDLGETNDITSLPPAFVKILEPVVQDIKYTLDLFAKERFHDGMRPERMVLSGGSALLPGMTAFLEQTFNVTAYVADPWARVLYPQVLKPVLDTVGPRFAVAIGLATRQL